MSYFMVDDKIVMEATYGEKQLTFEGVIEARFQNSEEDFIQMDLTQGCGVSRRYYLVPSGGVALAHTVMPNDPNILGSIQAYCSQNVSKKYLVKFIAYTEDTAVLILFNKQQPQQCQSLLFTIAGEQVDFLSEYSFSEPRSHEVGMLRYERSIGRVHIFHDPITGVCRLDGQAAYAVPLGG